MELFFHFKSGIRLQCITTLSFLFLELNIEMKICYFRIKRGIIICKNIFFIFSDYESNIHSLLKPYIYYKKQCPRAKKSKSLENCIVLKM